MSYSSTLLSFHLFTDDSNIFNSNKSLSTLKATINNELLKCLLVALYKQFVHEISATINNKPIKQEKQLKNLGVMIDNHLNWKSHISYICNEIKRSIGIISKARHYIKLKTLTSLYYSLIYQNLIYGIVIWGYAYKSVLTLYYSCR